MNGLIPLSMVGGNKEVTVVAINAGRGLQARLFSLGLIPGVTIKVLSNSRPGPVRISIKAVSYTHLTLPTTPYV